MDGCYCHALVVKAMSRVLSGTRVMCFGEALIDMLSNKVNGDATTKHETFTQFAGGAPANVSVALAKLGGNSYFCGMLGRDAFGDFLLHSLLEYGVKTDYVLRTDKAKTALAFVSLDQQGERTFSFYRPPAADLCFSQNDFQAQWFEQTAIFHFCSNSLTESGIQEATQAGITLAKQHRALVSFDVNLRQNLWSQQGDPFGVIWSVMSGVDVLKVSREELEFLCAKQTQEQTIARLLHCGCQLILISDGCRPLQWITANMQGEIEPPQVSMVDATAAGDAFVGGLLFKLQEFFDRKGDLETLLSHASQLSDILRFACACGAHAASIYGAFPSLPSLSSLDALTREIHDDIT
ncbi:carbohydrate kinase family protein [Marinagarivorans algicola]|uniref:carbohydrate kinase family protein n=1 Tax=Marinagarivorans algicola TaxID=1513270 RepID=UPI003736A033